MSVMSEIELTLRALLAAHHKPELADVEFDHVYQVWEDGEISLQKCGSLLWQRTLHTIEAGNVAHAVPIELFPCQFNGHGFIYTDADGATAVRNAILGR